MSASKGPALTSYDIAEIMTARMHGATCKTLAERYGRSVEGIRQIIIRNTESDTNRIGRKDGRALRGSARVISADQIARLSILRPTPSARLKAAREARRIEMTKLRLLGWSYAEIGAKFGITHVAVHYVVNGRPAANRAREA